MTDTIKIDAFDRFMAVSHFDEEMAEAHTPTEDAMAYCIRKASKSDYRNGQGAMVDDATVFSWVKEYFTAEKVETKSVVGKTTTGSKESTKKPKKPPKTKKIPKEVGKQLDLFSDLSVEEGEF